MPAATVQGVPVQLVECGLFGDDQHLLCDDVDRMGITTHYPFDAVAFDQSLKEELRAEWADPIKWLLGDPDREDIRAGQHIWMETPRCALPLPPAPSSTLTPVVDPFTFEVTDLVAAVAAPTDHMTSPSLTRPPAPASDFVRGARLGVPFAFGGVAYPTDAPAPPPASISAALAALDSGTGLNGPPRDCRLAEGDTGGDEADEEDKAVYSLAAPNTQGKPTEISLNALLVGEGPEADEHTNTAPTLILNETEPVVENEQPVDTLLRMAPIPRPLPPPRRPRPALPESAPNSFAWAITQPTDVSDYASLVPDPAIRHPFELDNFQKQAVIQLERGNFVFVAAHTSAGKTVVAEYAIALARRNLTRAIYTSPIKTLSNQKFREFHQRFGEAGLLTGDAQVNPTSTVLIMTTEILRSMLYRGADIVRDVEWVIFDEVHYVNDPERGHVWEEVIIMLPPHVKLVMLSATVPNSTEFADWIGRTKQRPVYVISTPKRPVPLRYFLHYEGKQHEIVSEGKFQSATYRQLKEFQREKEKKSPHLQFQPADARQRAEKQQWVRLVLQLKEKELLPVVVFAFSKKRCEELSAALGNVDLNTKPERSRVVAFMDRCLQPLKPQDRELPQIQRLRASAQRGIGVHHAGLLPLMKEMVEILFQQGLIKVLFATETFAMGVNMPARTVVFASIRKHDGREFRELRTGEFIQMAGRAGRRGLDDSGMVLIACLGDTGLPDEGPLQHMMTGTATQLQSQFRLTYAMILNLLKLDFFRVEDMLRRSFGEARAARLVPLHRRTLREAQAKLAALPALDCIKGEPAIEDFHRLHCDWSRADAALKTALLTSGLKSLGIGRIVVVQTEKYGRILGFVVKATAPPGRPKIPLSSSAAAAAAQPDAELAAKWFQLVVLRAAPKIEAWVPTLSGLPPFPAHAFTLRPLAEAVDVPLADIVAIARDKVPMPEDKGRTGKTTAVAIPPLPVLLGLATNLLALWERHPTGELPVMHPIHDFKLNSLEAVDRQADKESALAQLATHKCSTCSQLPTNFVAMRQRHELRQVIDGVMDSLADKNLALVPDFEAKLRVLTTLGYINEDQRLQLKGRVCAEIHSGHELLMTEVVFRGLLTPMTPVECAAFLSCLVAQDKAAGTPTLSEPLLPLKEILTELAEELTAVQTECGVADGAAPLVESALNFGLMDVAYEWAKGASFAEICNMTPVLEGSLVRTFTQLDQAVRDVGKAARLLGDAELAAKMEQAGELIKRDIVFAGSLYLHFPAGL